MLPLVLFSKLAWPSGSSCSPSEEVGTLNILLHDCMVHDTENFFRRQPCRLSHISTLCFVVAHTELTIVPTWTTAEHNVGSTKLCGLGPLAREGRSGFFLFCYNLSIIFTFSIVHTTNLARLELIRLVVEKIEWLLL